MLAHLGVSEQVAGSESGIALQLQGLGQSGFTADIQLQMIFWLQIVLFNHVSWVDSILMMRMFAPSGVAKVRA